MTSSTSLIWTFLKHQKYQPYWILKDELTQKQKFCYYPAY